MRSFRLLPFLVRSAAIGTAAFVTAVAEDVRAQVETPPPPPLGNRIIFGPTVGGVWGGAFAADRDLIDAVDLTIEYTDGSSEAIDFMIWSAGLYGGYEYGASWLRLRTTLLARFDTHAYSAGGGEYQSLGGSGMLSSRYALLVGPAVTLSKTASVSLDVSLGVGGVLGSYRPAAGVVDAFEEVAGEGSLDKPASTGISGLAARASFELMLWDPKFGIGIALYYDVCWLNADLPLAWPQSWFDHGLGVMVPIVSRF